MEGEVITLQKLFEFKIDHFDTERRIIGKLHPTGLRPGFLGKFERHGIELPLSLFGGATDAIFGTNGESGRRQMRLARALFAAFVVALVLSAASAAASPRCQITPVTRLPFPERGYVVSLSEAADLNAGSVEVRENGLRVTGCARRPACGQRAALRRRARAGLRARA